VTRKYFIGFASAALALALSTLWLGCGLNPEEKPIPPPVLPNWPALNAQDVLDNMAYAYNQMDYERYYPLIDDRFTFEFNEEDINAYPDQIPPEGVWGQSEELVSAEHMLNRDYIPPNPADKIDNLELDMQFSGEPEPTNMQGAPPGTLEGFVTFDLRVQTAGGTVYLVHSRPLFFFAPSGTLVTGVDTTFVWRIWHIKDAPFGQQPGGSAAAED